MTSATLDTLRLFVLDAITSHEAANWDAAKPCPDYAAHLKEARAAVRAADTLDALAAVDFVAARAEIARHP